jgi:hypothetical protein
MSSANNSSSLVSKMIPYLIFFAGFVGLYFLYQYLFGPKTGSSYTLLAKKQSAIVDTAAPIIIDSSKLPRLYEGGEFSVSTWIYVNNWTHRMNSNKPILIIGGTNFDTLYMYLGATKPSLKVRFHTKESSPASQTNTTVAQPKSNRDAIFGDYSTAGISSLLDDSTICDIPEIDLQRWINIVVAVNGKTVDVYIDGKLTRSCVLPATFKVDSGGYSALVLPYNGFGGQISKTEMYDAALYPEAVYKNYMMGPAL